MRVEQGEADEFLAVRRGGSGSPVAALVSVTVTPGMTAALGSSTRTLNEPASICADAMKSRPDEHGKQGNN